MAIVNPETRTIHFTPGERCNLDDARADPGEKPYKVKLREALALLEKGYAACEAEDEDD